MTTPQIVSPEEWEAAREELLVKEKELTRARDAMAAQRRRMPRMAVEKEYAFEGPHGPATLLDLFEGRRQLIVYRFFFEPGVAGWPDHGCGGCSFLADQVAHLAHLNARDTTLAFVSRAPQPEIDRWQARMGWQDIPWYTITDDFDADFGVEEWHGTNAFARDGDRILRTYFCLVGSEMCIRDSSFSTAILGIRRRCAAIASRARVSSFSLTSSSARAASLSLIHI